MQPTRHRHPQQHYSEVRSVQNRSRAQHKEAAPIISQPIQKVSADKTLLVIPATRIELQEDGIHYIKNFMMTPFTIQGTLTEVIRQKIKTTLKRNSGNPAVQKFLNTPMMQTKESVPYEVTVPPAWIFMNLLKAADSDSLEYIGGDSRRALKGTYKKMTETVLEKTVTFSQKKEDEFSSLCPDADFIIPKKEAPYEKLLELSDVTPALITKKLFGELDRESFPIYCYFIREIMFEQPEIFNGKYSTGNSFGNSLKKIDITFTPRSEHNIFFEFNKLAITIKSSALEAWLDHLSTPEGSITLNTSLCFDNGYQAAYDFFHDILRSNNSRDVNDRGFATLMLWISRGYDCTSWQTLTDFHETLQKTHHRSPQEPSLPCEVARQLILSHISHNMGNGKLLMASFLNACVALNLIDPANSDEAFDEIKKRLHDQLITPYQSFDRQNTFVILTNAYLHQRLPIQLSLSWLTACCFIGNHPQKNAFGKTALQLNDEVSLILPFSIIDSLNFILDNFKTNCAEDFKALLLRLTSTTCFDPARIDPLKSEERKKLTQLTHRFLGHPETVLRRLGLRLNILLVRHEKKLNPELTENLLKILVMESADTVQQLLNDLKNALKGTRDELVYQHLFNELAVEFTKTALYSRILNAWMFLLLKSKQSDLEKQGMNVWKELPEAEKRRDVSQYIEIVMPFRPDEALAVYTALTEAPQWEDIAKIMGRLKHVRMNPLSYSVNFEKAISKALAVLDKTPWKIRAKKRPTFSSSEFFWILSVISLGCPEKVFTHMDKFAKEGFITLKSKEAAQAVFGLRPNLKIDDFLKVWSYAEKNGCPLWNNATDHYHEFFVILCESLWVEKNPHFESFVNRTLGFKLKPDHKLRLQKLIQQFAVVGHPLTQHLTKEQQSEVSVNNVIRLYDQHQYLDALKQIDKIWSQSSEEGQKRLLNVYLSCTSWLYNELEKNNENDRRKLNALIGPFMDVKLSLLEKIKPDQLHRDLVECTILVMNRYLELFFDGRGLSSQMQRRLTVLVNPLAITLIRRKSYALAYKFLDTLSYLSIEASPTENMMKALLSMSEDAGLASETEKTLTLLKFYQQREACPDVQLAMYVNLTNHFIKTNAPRTNIWIERVLSFCSAENPLSGSTLIQWTDMLYSRNQTAVFQRMYSSLAGVKFENEVLQQSLLWRWATQVTCPYFSAQLIYDQDFTLCPEYNFNTFQIIILKVLLTWLNLPSPECTETMLYLVKLVSKKEPQLWCQILELLSKPSQPVKFREDCWLLYKLSQGRGNYEGFPQLSINACLFALRGSRGLKPEVFESLILISGLDGIRRVMALATPEQREEAIRIIFTENLINARTKKDAVQATFIQGYILESRNNLKEIKRWNAIDLLIYSELVKMGNPLVIRCLLSHLDRIAQEEPTLCLDKVFQPILKVLHLDHVSNFTTSLATHPHLIDRVDLKPLLRIGLHCHPVVLLGISLLILPAMKATPCEEDKRLLSALVNRIADTLIDKTVISSLLKHPNAQLWFSEADFEKYSVLVLAENLKRHAAAESPFKKEAMDGFYESYHRIKSFDGRKKCIEACIHFLLRYFHESQSELQIFHHELIKFFRIAMSYEGANPTTEMREPRDLPRTTLRAAICDNKEEIINALEKETCIKNHSTQQAFIKKLMPNRDFLTAEEFLEYAIRERKGKDDHHMPEFRFSNKSIEDIPELFKDLPNYRVNTHHPKIEPIQSPPVIVETIDYLFTDINERDLYVYAVAELIRSFTSVPTNSLKLRNVVMHLCTGSLLFLIENYWDHADQVLKALDDFVFAPAMVDSQKEKLRTVRGNEKYDQNLFDKHNQWCHEIITMIKQREISQVPMSFYQAMLVIYPLEIYPLALSNQEQIDVIVKTIDRLIASHSSVHYGKALEILRHHQNIVLEGKLALADCYENFITALLRDPNYIIIENQLIVYGPKDGEGNRNECTYESKKPLFYLLASVMRENHTIFGSHLKDQHTSSDVKWNISISGNLSTKYFNVLLTMLEDKEKRFDNPSFDILEHLIETLRSLAYHGCFLHNQTEYREFVYEKLRPHIIERLRQTPVNEKLTTFIKLNLAILMQIGIAGDHQRKAWMHCFNQVIRELLEISDSSLRAYLIETIVKDTIANDSYAKCREQLDEINKICQT